MITNYKLILNSKKVKPYLVLLFFLFCFQIQTFKSQCAGGTYSFTTAGATFSAGPTQAQINAAYLATNLNGSVTVTGGIQSFTVPTTGVYQITAAGAGGGNANAFGGRGRIVQGSITLTAGQVLRVLVGQKGQLTTSSGGGGGSYVVDAAGNNTIIVGGGGAGFVGALGAAIASSDGNILTAGFNSNSGGTGGINGNGGNGSTGWGGGGGGFNTNGTDAAACVNTRGFAFLNGGAGGQTCNNTVGGFGGGGGTHGNTGGGGGGGGFSGGGGSDQNLANAVGGGGGSFFNATMTGTTNVGVNLNAGFVTIIQPSLAPCAGIPTAGNATASQTTGCSTYTTNLSLSGNIQACNLTYQWYVAPAIGGPYAAIPGFTLMNAVANASLATQFYRCVLVCGANSATSSAVNCLVTACVGTPTPGIAAASPSVGCATYTTNLSLSGNVVTCGLTYQWQSGPAVGGPWTNIVGATSVSASVSNTVTTYYRCVLTCAGTTLASVAAVANNVPCSCAGGTYTFTNAGATFSAGPTQAQINAAYLATNLNGLVTVNGGIQSFTVPVSGVYEIVAAGAGGGNANAFGGRGRIVKGDISLTAGQVLRILVGQKGQLTTSSGGGGGSYVAQTVGNTTILVGGGGAGFVGALGAAIPSSDGNILTAGFNSNSGGVGGINGNGGNGSAGWGGGGGGFNTNGTDAAACVNTRGFAFLNGGAGGNTCNNTVGGFGGGGGTHGNTGGGGGGGGFSGGGGSDQNLGNAVGGGGGSFFNATMTNTLDLGYNLNEGYVTLKQPFLPMCAGTPTPGTAVANPSTACTAYTTNLSLTGAVATCSQTYQWFAAPAPGGPYTAIPGATLITANVNNTVTTYYRCELACGGSTAVSTTATAAIPPCVGSPTPGTAVASPSAGCSTFSVNLSLVGNIVTCGLSYQWQSSPAPGGPYVNIPGATAVTATVPNNVTTYYRCIVSCGGSTASSVEDDATNSGVCQVCPAMLDVAANANGASTFTIQTNFPNELLMITYAGWNGPGSGPVAVDGVNATLVSIANNGNSGTTEIYAKTVAAAGVHTIVCTETGYSYPPYGINFAAGFYTSNCALTLANITGTVVNTIACVTGGSIQASIVTTQPNEMIYTSAEINNGQGGNYPILWTNANFLASLHIGNGIDAGHGYSLAPVAGTYSIVATNTSNPNNGCGGLCIILTKISPCSCVVLPVGIEKFKCTPTKEGMFLNWSTISESNSSYFTLERSADANTFTSIGKVKAAGNSQSTKDYFFKDKDVLTGNHYYRLKQTDLDGKSQTFDVHACNFSEEFKVEIFPNPNNGNYTIVLDASSSQQTLELSNALGEVVFTQQFSPNTKTSSNTVSMPTNLKGVFIAKIISGNKLVAVKKILVN